MIPRILSIAGAAAIALLAGKFGLLAVAPLAALLWFRAVESALGHYGRRRGRAPVNH